VPQPQLALHFTGEIGRTGFPTVTATFNSSPGSPALGTAAVIFPVGELLAFSHLDGVCATERFLSAECAPGSLRGWAQVWSPMLEAPLRAPVYLRQSDSKLPELAAHLGDQVDLISHIDTPHARFRLRLAPLGDLPISRLMLHLEGGSRGLFENGESLCPQRRYASATLSDLSGRRQTVRSPIAMAC
jgi:hypothetical protein